MKLQENQRYTLNEVKQYLTENAESKAYSYCRKNKIDVDIVKNLFPKWRIRNCKYFLTLCRMYFESTNFYPYLDDINKLLTVLGFSDDIDSKFTRALDDTTDEKYANSPEEIHKRVLNFKNDNKGKKLIKLDDTNYAIKDYEETYGSITAKSYKTYDALRDEESYVTRTNDNFDISPRRYNYFNTLREYSEKYIKVYNEAIKAELNNMPKENTGRYEIIPIHNFDESSEYSKYTSWCVTNDHSMYHEYTQEKYGNAMFYFCLRDDYEDIEPNENESGRNALDDYGISMFAVLVKEINEDDIYNEDDEGNEFDDGGIVQITSRWNHSYGGGDNVIDVIELSRYLGFDVRTEIQYDGGEEDYYDEDGDYRIEEYNNWVDGLWDDYELIETLSNDYWGNNRCNGIFIVRDSNGYYNIRVIDDDGDIDEEFENKESMELPDWAEDIVNIKGYDIVCINYGDNKGIEFYDYTNECYASADDIPIDVLKDYLFKDIENIESLKDNSESSVYKAKLFNKTIVYSIIDDSRTISCDDYIYKPIEWVNDECYDDIVILQYEGDNNLYAVNINFSKYYVKIDEFIEINEDGVIVRVGEKQYIINHIQMWENDKTDMIEVSNYKPKIQNESLNYIKNLNKRIKLL